MPALLHTLYRLRIPHKYSFTLRKCISNGLKSVAAGTAYHAIVFLIVFFLIVFFHRTREPVHRRSMRRPSQPTLSDRGCRLEKANVFQTGAFSAQQTDRLRMVSHYC